MLANERVKYTDKEILEKGYEFLQVKTLDESYPDFYYAKTRKFYTISWI